MSHMFNTVKLVLSCHSKGRPKIGFQDLLSLNAGQKYCRMLQESILQYFRPSLSYHLSLRPLFCLFLSGRLRQGLLYWSYTFLFYSRGLFVGTVYVPHAVHSCLSVRSSGNLTTLRVERLLALNSSCSNTVKEQRAVMIRNV